MGQVKSKAKEIEVLGNTAPAQIWANDLDALETALVRLSRQEYHLSSQFGTSFEPNSDVFVPGC